MPPNKFGRKCMTGRLEGQAVDKRRPRWKEEKYKTFTTEDTEEHGVNLYRILCGLAFCETRTTQIRIGITI
jgi:hypothetical protein